MLLNLKPQNEVIPAYLKSMKLNVQPVKSVPEHLKHFTTLEHLGAQSITVMKWQNDTKFLLLRFLTPALSKFHV